MTGPSSPPPPAYAASQDDIRAAAARLAPYLHRTPVLTSRSLDRLAGRSVYFKCEPFQKGGSFKIRGALNAVLCLDEAQAARGVLTHSSGNFAQALTIAAGLRGIPVTVVMPDNAPAVKVAAVREYGGRVVPCPPHLRAETAARIQAETGATYLPSYDHPDVIAGQATCAMELLEQAPELDLVLAPVGGGGLLAGTALAVHHLRPQAVVYAAEPLGADDAARSKAMGQVVPQDDPRTIADGLRTSLGVHTWPVLRDLVEQVVTVPEADIVRGMRQLWERLKVVVEPSGAVPWAAVLQPAVQARVELRRVGVVLSGGNVDLDALPF